MPLRNNRGWKKKMESDTEESETKYQETQKMLSILSPWFTKQSETSYRNCSGRAVPTVSGRPSGLPSYPPASH